MHTAQSAGAIEYTDSTSAEGSDSPNQCSVMILNNLTEKFQYGWSFGECRVPLDFHRSQVPLGSEW